MCNNRNQGFSLMGILFAVLISASVMLTVNKYYKEANDNSDVTAIAAKSLTMLNNIKEWNVSHDTCQTIHTVNVLASGLAPEGWAINDPSVSFLDRVLKLKYRYGFLRINSNLTPVWIAGSGINPNQGFSITFDSFPRNKVPGFIENLIDHFDLVDVGGVIVKNESGVNNANLNNVYNNEIGLTYVSLITWGC